MASARLKIFHHAVVGLLGLALLYLDFLIFMAGHFYVGLALLFVIALALITYSWSKAYTWRYLFPGLFGFGLFVIFPLIFTVYISFTNYSSANLLSFSKVVAYFEEETYLASEQKYRFDLLPAEGAQTYRLYLTDQADRHYLSPPLDLANPPAEAVALEVVEPDNKPGDALSLRDVIQVRNQLGELSLQTPEGKLLTMTGLRDFGPRLPLWEQVGDDPVRLRNVQTGEVIAPDSTIGKFIIIESGNEARIGEPIGPGYRIWVGLDNYLSIITDDGIRGPFIKIFIWTIVFALGSVFFSLCVGMFLAVLLQWKELPYRKLYRTLLILPYAVPAFISILIFKGLFNQNFGEINMLLDALFGIRPEWFADPLLAKIMILMVNTWLGYPYMMIVCTGILQSVPSTIYEASSLDGSNPLTDFFRLTLPLIFAPLFPLLVASFAFNFNNFLLIYLLTGGGPDMTGATVVAGETDILVSYTFRLAFRNTGQLFGYASAIATIIFIIVAAIAWWNLRYANREK